MRRPLAALAVAAALLASLAGCVPGAPVNVKTAAVAKSIDSLPGITQVTVDSQEASYYTAARSDVFADLATDATAAQVARILDAFAQENRRLGTDVVSSRLRLIVGSSANQLDLEFAGLTDAQATASADSWFALREQYQTALLHLSGPDDLTLDVTVTLGGEPSVERDLAALEQARDLETALGPVSYFTAVDGNFGASRGLPDDAALDLARAVAALIEVSGEYYGDEDSFGFKADFVPSDTALQQQVAALVAPGVAVDIAFRTADGTAVFLNTASCNAYAGLSADDPSVALLAFWAADGRTLVDGSSVASCLA